MFQFVHIPQVPDLCEDLLSSVDQPLKIARDKQVGKDYLLCDYNRDGDSYRLVTTVKIISHIRAVLCPDPRGVMRMTPLWRMELCQQRD